MPKIDKIFAQLVFLAIFRSSTTFDLKLKNLDKSQDVKSYLQLSPKLLIIPTFTHSQLPYSQLTPFHQIITEKWAQNDPFSLHLIANN